MEDHGAGCHPLLHGHLQPAHAYGPWDPPLAAFDDGNHHHQQQMECFSTASELRDALLRALAELEAARGAHREELRRVEHEAARLVPPPPPQSVPDPPLHGVLGLGLGGGAGGMAVGMDEAATSEEEAEVEMALARRLPEKGRLVEAVVSAGPLLQTLLLAGPLPRWRHPPPPASADVIPPFNPGRPDGNYSLSSASASSSPESNCSGGNAPPAAAQPQQHALPCFHMSSSFCM
ncbi:uncharacterized protein LOC123424828 [Hordeum vulgare subsp. vulgare]|uniref:uncharacterized protein LOC123424828 n=1 Tax=Hordeum vulgare subsp. vulgare TaxID=112509 RepID=UPI001D1A35DA|nr:uncharacterized protein LOC123424828 [Hordeum vulgare subsp. vulgare]